MESRKRAWITLQQLLQKSKTYRDEGKQVMKSNSLIAAKQCYNEALNCLVPGFQRLTALDDETKLPLKEEIAIIFGNLSLVNLRQGNPEEAYQNAHQSIAYNPTAKGHYRLAEACSYSPMHCKEALTNYHTSYSLEEDITTYCKYFILAVGVGHNPVVPEVLETYTPMLEKLICQPQFNFIHLEVLLLKQCSIPIPNIKCGIAIQKCSTFCIKELSALMKLGLQWNLVVALINHGTVPDEAAIEVSIHIYNKSVSTLFIAEKVLGVVQYDHLLSLAISKEWHGQFVNYCISQGGKFSPNDIWSVLKWKDDSKIKSLFKKLLKNGGSVNVKNSKGQYKCC
ncbi:uncharacterized protein [Dysidea avara]|uniref:uncharacterized protein n=1 Tax=Dysidea avara TaxID=196820 RepID=UPI00332586C3